MECISSIRRKKAYYPCLFYFSAILLIAGISLIVTAVIVNRDAEQHKGWLAFGCIAGSILLIFGFGFSLIFWHFGKERDQRHVLDYETAKGDKRVPKSIEAKMEASKEKNRMREMAKEQLNIKSELERKATMQSNRTVQTILPGSRVTSQESANMTDFQPIYEGVMTDHEMGHDNYSFDNRGYE